VTAPAPAPSDVQPASLFTRPNLPLAVGAVALVTLAALENRAVMTALPTMVRELDAITSYGVINAAPLAAFVVSLAVAGVWADRGGPVPPLRAGAVGFALAQLAIGTASEVPMVIAGRVLSGLAEGLIDVGLMVLVARALPQELRPRMFALFAAAWVLPSVFGPLLTGLVTEGVGWRWVFLGAVGFVVPTWLLLRPAIAQVRARPAVIATTRAELPGPSPEPTDAPRPEGAGSGTAQARGTRSIVPWAMLAAAAVFSLGLAGEQLAERTPHAALAIVASALVAVVSAGYLLPAGTLLARSGMPAIVATRGLVAAAFGGAGSWLPLLLTEVHGFRPALTGISLSITGVMWAFGSWLQARDLGLARIVVLRAGLLAMTAGLAVTSLLAWTHLPAAVGLAGWAVAGIGMGLISPTVSVLILERSDATNQGRNTSAGQLAVSLGAAVSLAISGTAVAFAAPEPGRIVFAAIVTASAGIAAVAALASRRVA
jgi:MFS family permease